MWERLLHGRAAKLATLVPLAFGRVLIGHLREVEMSNVFVIGNGPERVEKPLTSALWRSYRATKCASLLRETMWSMVQEIHSELDFDYPAWHTAQDDLDNVEENVEEGVDDEGHDVLDDELGR